MRATSPYLFVYSLAGLLLTAASPLQADRDEGLGKIIKLPESKGTVYELLEKVAERSGYLFIYDSQAINNEQLSGIKKGSYTVRQAIYEITGNRRLSLRISGEHILIQLPPAEQPSPPVISGDSRPAYLTMEGTLLDRYTREPVAYATVGIPAYAIGTVSNRNGDFRLRIPDSLQNPVASISHIGYLTGDIPLEQPPDGAPRVFLLEPKVISIQEVVVRLVNPLRLLHDMRNKRETNYSRQPVYFTAFYREGIERKKGFVNLTEAVFKIYKTPYNNDPSADQVKLLKMRRISNENERDTLITKIKSGINACLMLDMVKNLPDFLLPENEHQYNYVHSDITVIDNRMANIISFEQKKDVKEPLYKGELFLDSENDALLSARFEIHPRYVEKATGMLVTRKSKNLHIASRKVVYHVSYKPWNGTYYINHIRGDLYFKIKKSSRLFSSTTIHTWFEMVTCNIETEDVTRFTRNETLRTRTVFAETDFHYDRDFWGNFNIILPEEKLNEDIRRIISKIEETGY
jgi:hypothetical protein